MTRAPATPRGAEKAPHPADVRRADVLANPAGFSASIRFNSRNNTVRVPTLSEAATLATALETAVAALGGTTRATVYALPRDGGGPEVVAPPEWRGLVSVEQARTIAANIAANLKG